MLGQTDRRTFSASTRTVATTFSLASPRGRNAAMEIDRDHVVALLREKGQDERVQHALDALPQKVDHEKHAQELEKLGIDPGELLAKAGHSFLG